MKVDIDELERQVTLKSGKYALYKIVVPKMEGSKLPKPIIRFNLHKVSPVEVATILSALKESYKLIAKQFPEAVPILEKFFKSDNIYTEMIDKSKSLIDIEEDESEAESGVKN